MLSELNFNVILNNPKWIQGYSDPTSLLFTITTNLDIATIYANNFKTFSMNPWHYSLENNFKILKGNIIKQESFDLYEKDFFSSSNDGQYNLDTPVIWKNLFSSDCFNIHGRIIGGCIDVLGNLIGTRFDKTKEFVERYKDDGIIWYFENCELTNEDIVRVLWQMKEANWFKYVKGIVFGRSATDSSYYNVSFKNAISTSLSYLNVPIIYDVDIGHVAPRMTIINGAIANINFCNGKGYIEMFCK